MELMTANRDHCEITILVIDDEPLFLKMLTRILKSLGYSVLDTSTYDDAIRLTKLNSDKIDLVITDVIMPGINGPELTEMIREIKPSLKFLYTSGYSFKSLNSDGIFKRSSIHFLEKPFSKEALQRKIQNILDETHLL